jgi:hypothetical protein
VSSRNFSTGSLTELDLRCIIPLKKRTRVRQIEVPRQLTSANRIVGDLVLLGSSTRLHR